MALRKINACKIQQTREKQRQEQKERRESGEIEGGERQEERRDGFSSSPHVHVGIGDKYFVKWPAFCLASNAI